MATARWLARTMSAVWASAVKASTSGPSMFSTPTSFSRWMRGIAISALTPGKKET